jgi:hypothetical protein
MYLVRGMSIKEEAASVGLFRRLALSSTPAPTRNDLLCVDADWTTGFRMLCLPDIASSSRFNAARSVTAPGRTAG